MKSILLTQTRPPSDKETKFWNHRGYTKILHQSLLDVEFSPIEPLNITPQAIVITSSNAALALESSDWDRSLPVYAVGNATALKAKAIGFENSISPSNKAYPSALSLIEWIKENLNPEDGPIIFGCGNHLRHDVAEILHNCGFQTSKVILYTTKPSTAFHQNIEEALRNNAINAVVINSEMALYGFVDLCIAKDINAEHVPCFVPSKFLQECAHISGFSDVFVINH